MNELEHFWLVSKPEFMGRSWFPPQQSFNLISSLFTDASKYAWGAHLTAGVR
jgi:hypothetical protein